MLGKSRTAINNVSFPQDGRKILGSTSDRCHRKSFPILVIRVIEIIFAFTKVDELKLVIGEQKNISWLDISMTDPLGLQEGAGRNHAAVHGDQFSLSPK